MSLCQTDHRFVLRWERRRRHWWNEWQWFQVLFCACCDLRIEEP